MKYTPSTHVCIYAPTHVCTPERRSFSLADDESGSGTDVTGIGNITGWNVTSEVV